MGLLGRFRRRGLPPVGRSDGPDMNIDLAAVRRHFAEFAHSRRGVEAYVEPMTSVSAQTVVLVATDGEWTRRAVGTRKAAYELAAAIGIPIYDVLLTGYPPRMRQWTSQQRQAKGDDEKGSR